MLFLVFFYLFIYNQVSMPKMSYQFEKTIEKIKVVIAISIGVSYDTFNS